MKASNNSLSHGATSSPFLEPMGRKSDFGRWQELVGDQGSEFKDTLDTRCLAEVSDRCCEIDLAVRGATEPTAPAF